MNTLTFQIRNCNQSDIDAVENIEKTCYGSVNALPLISLKQYLEMFGQAFVVIELNGSVVGFAVGGVQLGNANKIGWLLDIAVLPKFQNQGLGKKLCIQIIQRLKKYGIEKIKATVSPDNWASLAMLREANFQVIEDDFNYFGPKQRRLLMECKIGE